MNRDGEKQEWRYSHTNGFIISGIKGPEGRSEWTLHLLLHHVILIVSLQHGYNTLQNISKVPWHPIPQHFIQNNTQIPPCREQGIIKVSFITTPGRILSSLWRHSFVLLLVCEHLHLKRWPRTDALVEPLKHSTDPCGHKVARRKTLPQRKTWNAAWNVQKTP